MRGTTCFRATVIKFTFVVPDPHKLFFVGLSSCFPQLIYSPCLHAPLKFVPFLAHLVALLSCSVLGLYFYFLFLYLLCAFCWFIYCIRYYFDWFVAFRLTFAVLFDVLVFVEVK